MANMMNKSPFLEKSKNEVSDEVKRKKLQRKERRQLEEDDFFSEMLEEVADDELYTLMKKIK